MLTQRFLLALVVLLGVTTFTTLAAFSSGVSQVTTQLNAFQGETGGFAATPGGPVSVESTVNAALISSLFGIQSQIDTDKAIRFVQSVYNPDHGYGVAAGQPSDIESTRNAILVFRHFQAEVSGEAETLAFVESLFDKTSGLYAASVGDRGSLTATAQALETVALLSGDGKLKNEAAVKASLEKMVKGEAPNQYFSTKTSENAHAIQVALAVGMNIDKNGFAKYFSDRISAENGFSQTANTVRPAVDATYDAVKALELLGRRDISESAGVMELISSLPGDLDSTAKGLGAVALIGKLPQLFTWRAGYDVMDAKFPNTDTTFIVGSEVRIAADVRAQSGIPNTGLKVIATVVHSVTKEAKNVDLLWNPQVSLYTSTESYEATTLGDVEVNIKATFLTPALGQNVEFSYNDKKHVGFQTELKVVAEANGAEIAAGDEVPVGTEFNAEVSYNAASAAALKEQYTVSFSIVDASNVAVYTTTVDSNEENKYTFSHTLSNAAFPTGKLTVRVDASNKKGVHTTNSVAYMMNLPMVATDVGFAGLAKGEKAAYKIGDVIKVKFVPATLRSARTVDVHKGVDSNKNDIRAQRRYSLDFVASSGRVLRTVNSEAGPSADTHLFTSKVEAQFDYLGVSSLKFYYINALNQRVPIQVFDASLEEVVEDDSTLTVVVNSQLEAANLKPAVKNGELAYGAHVNFQFDVVDKLTSNHVTAAVNAKDSVFLVLRADADVVDRHAARLVTKGTFSVDYNVSPNAVAGPATLELVALSGNGDELPLLLPGTKQAWQISVTIVGEIDVEKSVLVTTPEGIEATVFAVNVELSSNNVKLTGARLVGRVSYQSGSELVHITDVPLLATSTPGNYYASWTMAPRKALHGTYVMDVQRESTGVTMFTVEVTHQVDPMSNLPVRTEVLALLVLVGAFIMLMRTKSSLESKK